MSLRAKLSGGASVSTRATVAVVGLQVNAFSFAVRLSGRAVNFAASVDANGAFDAGGVARTTVESIGTKVDARAIAFVEASSAVERALTVGADGAGGALVGDVVRLPLPGLHGLLRLEEGDLVDAVGVVAGGLADEARSENINNDKTL